MKILPDQIDQKDFYVQETPHGILVAPRKSKHSWGPEELHLRSLLLEKDGSVKSSGFPKFFNYGEKPEMDKALERAVARGAVEFVEKRDGSLLIGDHLEGRAHWRTRGQAELGEFEAQVTEALKKYPKLNEFIGQAPYPWVKEHSFLFEYTGPLNRIILPYEEGELHLLAIIHKPSLQVVWQGEEISAMCEATGVCRPEVYGLEGDWAQIKAQVAAWKGLEGVVARFTDERGQKFLVKIKSLEYLMRHALRYRLTGKRAVQFALMLDAAKVEDLKPLFEELTLDWETIEYVRPEVEKFLAERQAAEAKLALFSEEVAEWKRATGSDKKRFVDLVNQACATNPAYASRGWFNRAMQLHNGRAQEAHTNLLAELVGEASASVKSWREMGKAGVMKLLSGWGVEDEGAAPIDESQAEGKAKSVPRQKIS